jgi:hypothetical protein
MITNDLGEIVEDMPRYLASIRIRKVKTMDYVERIEKKLDSIVDYLRWGFVQATINDPPDLV